MLRDARDALQPDHLWVSTRCGPLSPAANLNMSRPDMVDIIKKRRLQAIRAYKGAIQAVYDQVASGGHARWEWPLKYVGWARNIIGQMVADCNVTAVKVAACQVGATTRKG